MVGGGDLNVVIIIISSSSSGSGSSIIINDMAKLGRPRWVESG